VAKRCLEKKKLSWKEKNGREKNVFRAGLLATGNFQSISPSSLDTEVNRWAATNYRTILLERLQPTFRLSQPVNLSDSRSGHRDALHGLPKKARVQVVSASTRVLGL
jgi:hypothetical protein